MHQMRAQRVRQALRVQVLVLVPERALVEAVVVVVVVAQEAQEWALEFSSVVVVQEAQLALELVQPYC